MNENKTSGSRIFLGALLILVGILMFFSINNMWDFSIGHIVFSFPFLIFIVGVLILLNSRNTTLGTILVLIGTFFLIPRIFPSIDYDGSLIFPLIIIGIGVAIIAKHRQPVRKIIPGNPASSENIRKDYIDDVAVFGGGTKVLLSDSFKGGNVTAIFGGSEIDLTGCKLADGENILDVLFVFGGSDIYVPKDWHIIVNVTPVFGDSPTKLCEILHCLLIHQKLFMLKASLFSEAVK
jgi:predicted membrane protein